MASIVHKVVGGQTYYYLREMARVGGKPKMVSQRYLGKASDIEAAMDRALAVPARTGPLAFGDLAGAWWILERLAGAAGVGAGLGARAGAEAAWGALRLWVCALAASRAAMLYSVSAITSYGHADVYLEDRWQLLGAIEAVNGVILFGLTTAFLYAAIHEVWPLRRD